MTSPFKNQLSAEYKRRVDAVISGDARVDRWIRDRDLPRDWIYEGVRVEREHGDTPLLDVTGDDPRLTLLIALRHFQESRYYYHSLESMETTLRDPSIDLKKLYEETGEAGIDTVTNAIEDTLNTVVDDIVQKGLDAVPSIPSIPSIPKITFEKMDQFVV